MPAVSFKPVDVDLRGLDDFLDGIAVKVALAVEDAAAPLAAEIAERAKGSDAFQDYTGTSRESQWHKQRYPYATTLRQSIKSKKSKFEGGGAIAYSGAPHAWIVEHGHANVDNRKGSKTFGKVIGHVPPHAYLAPAAQSVMDQAIRNFAAAIAHATQGER